MRWPFRRGVRRANATPATREPPDAASDEESDEDAFVCSSCGRSDLPETGGWDPPICLECDAQINFDAELEH